MNDQIDFDGITVSQLYTALIGTGLSQVDATTLAGNWILQNVGRTRRIFNYSDPLDAVDPACVAAFERTFEHQPWADYEDPVMAGESPGDRGFNWRFDRISDDLDALRADVGRAFACVALLREEVSGLLGELRAEVNRINRDIHAHHGDDDGSGGGFGVGGFTGPGVIGSTFVGSGSFNDTPVSIWQTAQGMMMLPVVNAGVVQPSTDPRIRKAGRLARFIAETPEVVEVFGGGVSIEAFRERFGGEVTRDGTLVADLIDVFPPQGRFATLDAMVDGVADIEGTFVRTTPGSRDALSDSLGLGDTGTPFAQAAVADLSTVPFKARSAFVQAGITELGALADIDPREATEVLARNGFQTTAGQTAEWIGLAKTLRNVR